MTKLSKVLALILAIVMVLNIGVLATETVDEAETTTTTEEMTTTLPEESTEEPSTEAVEDTTTEEPSTEATTEETTDVTEESTTEATIEESTTEATTEETTTEATTDATEESTTEATTEETTTEVAEESTTEVAEETTTEVAEESTTAPEEETTTTPEEETTTPEEETTTTPDVTEPDVTDPTEEPTNPDVTEPTEPEVTLPAAPANVSAGAFADGKVVIQWDKVEGAAGYDVYLKSGEEWELNGSVTKNKCSLKNILYNSKYVVGIKAYTMIDGVKYESAEIAEYTVLTGTDIPKANLTATASGDTITLKWDAIKGVSGYRVYIRKDGKWVKLTSGADNTYTYKKALPGEKYQFAVKPYAKGTEGTKFGSLKSAKVTTENYSKTTVKATDKTTTSITIKWDKVKNASNYRVYIYKNGKWTYHKGITKNAYTIKGLKDATSYKIKVKASFKVDGTVHWGSYSNTITVATEGKTVTAKRIDNLKKQFTKDNWSVKVYLYKGTDDEVAVTLAVKGDMVYIKEDYKADADLITLCNVKTKDSYLISHEYKEYVVVPEPSYAAYQYLLVTMFAPLDAKNVKAKTTVLDGKRVVAEYYKGKDGIKRTYYFDGDKVVAVKFTDSDGYSSVYSTYKVLGKPADSLFKFPKGYKEGRY